MNELEQAAADKLLQKIAKADPTCVGVFAQAYASLTQGALNRKNAELVKP